MRPVISLGPSTADLSRVTMTLTMPLSRDSVQWLCRWIVALHSNHLQNNLHRYEDVIFSVSRSPFIAKKYGHLLGESQGDEGDCDLDGGDTQVSPLHPPSTFEVSEINLI